MYSSLPNLSATCSLSRQDVPGEPGSHGQRCARALAQVLTRPLFLLEQFLPVRLPYTPIAVCNPTPDYLIYGIQDLIALIEIITDAGNAAPSSQTLYGLLYHINRFQSDDSS